MSEREKTLNPPGHYILIKIDHLDTAIQSKIEALQDAIERIEQCTNVELDIRLTLVSEKREIRQI